MEVMKAYRIQELIEAIPSTREKYCKFRGWSLPDNENGKDEGYLIKFQDGSYTWWPKKRFMKAIYGVQY